MKILALLVLSCNLISAEGFKLRVMRIQISNEDGAGMDGGLFEMIGGGDFEMKICTSDVQVSSEDQGGATGRYSMNCCSTGVLNTEVDNWERGHHDFFVGRQLGQCEDFRLEPGHFTSVTLQHAGRDGCKIDWVKLRGSKMQGAWTMTCPIGRKLDDDDYFIAPCHEEQLGYGPDSDKYLCNGRREFCDIPFNEFTFPGAHNSGTGQMDDPNFPCLYKNQDLTVREQLDFGIRFLDLDIIYSQGGRCRGLETGHGAATWIYQCFGSLRRVFEDVRSWMDENPREVVVIHLGELKNREQALPEVRQLLSQVWPDFNQGLNTHFQATHEWPTLGQALDDRKQLFVMIIFDESEMASELYDEYYQPERFIKVSKVKTPRLRPNLPRGAVSIMSAYGGGYVGDNCMSRVSKTEQKCRTMDADFIKLAAYGTLTNNAICLHEVAEKCNSRIPQILQACRRHKEVVNFLFADYPNFLGEIVYTLPEITERENMQRLQEQ